MSRRFITANRAQSFLLPPSIDDWIEEGHMVRFLHDCIGQFDLSEFTGAYSREGGSPYHPETMLTILLYAWCLGIRSSRKIAAACHERIDFRWAAGNLRPDHCAFARFFQRHGKAIEELFTQVLFMCEQAGAIRLGVVSLDGTKVGANASLSANRTLKRLREEIARMEEEMRREDAADAARGGAFVGEGDLPEELRRRQERLAHLRSAKERLELALAAERALAQASSSGDGGGGVGVAASSAPGFEQGGLPFGEGAGAPVAPCPASAEPACGVSVEDDAPASAAPSAPPDEAKPERPAEAVQTVSGADGGADGASSAPSAPGNEAREAADPPPSAPSPTKKSGDMSRKKKQKPKDEEKARLNLTDPESRIMKGRQGLVQGFNAQAAVTREQFIVACAVTQEENDLHQLEPMLAEIRRSLAAAGIKTLPKKLLADAGYWLKDLDIEALEESGPELFIATCNPKNRPREAGRGRIPQSATATERMTRKLSTQAGQKTYKQRGHNGGTGVRPDQGMSERASFFASRPGEGGPGMEPVVFVPESAQAVWVVEEERQRSAPGARRLLKAERLGTARQSSKFIEIRLTGLSGGQPERQREIKKDKTRLVRRKTTISGDPDARATIENHSQTPTEKWDQYPLQQAHISVSND